MRGLFGSLTTRGRSFVAGGGAAMVCGLAIPEPDLVRVGALLAVCDGQLEASLQELLSDLLERNQEGALDGAERRRLDDLMRTYRVGLVRKAQALKVAVNRGLRPRLS